MVSRNGNVFAVPAEEAGTYEDPRMAKYEGYNSGMVGGTYSGMGGDTGEKGMGGQSAYPTDSHFRCDR